MILSRVWYLLLAIVAAMGFAFALVSVRLIDSRGEEAVRDDLRRDRFELEAILKLDARSRIDAIAPLAAHGDVRSALREATGRRGDAEIDTAVVQRLTTRLTELNRQLEGMSGDLLFATDAQGIIAAQVGGPPPPRGAGLGAFALVRSALDGNLRDDVWVFHDGVYRMAARPVIDGGQYVGAIIHGKRVDAGFAELLSSRLQGASVGFFHRDQMFASAMADQQSLPSGVSAPRQDDMAAPLAEVLTSEAMAEGERTDPMPLPTGGLAVYSPIVGAASHAQVGYAIARPVPSTGSLLGIFSLPSSEDWAELFQSTPGIVLIASALLAFLIGLFFIYIERDRPLAKFRDATASLAKRDVDKLIPVQFGGSLRTAAAHINEALEKVQDGAAAAPKRRAADLDEILGPVPDQQQAPAFFGFAGGTETEAAAPSPADIPPAPSAATPSAASTPEFKAPPAPPRPPGPPGAPGMKPPPPRPPGPPPSSSAHQAVTAVLPEVTPAPGSSSAVPRPSPALGSTLLGMPAEPLAGGAGPVQAPRRHGDFPTTASGSSLDQDDEEDGATMVARVPEELLAKAAHGGESADEQEKHFREVFEEFVSTKKQCSEPVTGLTYDKFVVTLRKNRDQIVKRHDAAKVRFTVYVKDGKAALKATPIRD